MLDRLPCDAAPVIAAARLNQGVVAQLRQAWLNMVAAALGVALGMGVWTLLGEV